MSHYDFNMPWPPSVNGYWRTFQSRQIISKRGREYRKLADDQLKKLGLNGENVSGRLALTIRLNPPTARKYDIDNFCKGLFDALSKSNFWEDDEQVDSLKITKGEKVKGGNVNVIVEILD